MALYSKEVEELKKELTNLRQIDNFYSYVPLEYEIEQFQALSYKLDDDIVTNLEKINQEQLKDVATFLKVNHHHQEELKQTIQQPEFEEPIDLNNTEENKYFTAKPIDISLDKLDFFSYHNMFVSEEINEQAVGIMQNLDKIFKFEINRLKSLKTMLNTNVALQKINKVHQKVKENKLSEALNLMNRFYNENKKHTIIGYLYMELLYAKVSKGNLKSLSKAREVANNVCFLTDKSDDSMIRYYRYIYVCREIGYSKPRALQLFRDFVLMDPDVLKSKNILDDDSGVYLKSILLFLRFDSKEWNSFDIHCLVEFSQNALAGGAFYIQFIRNKIISTLETRRFKVFALAEHSLLNIHKNHINIIDKLVSHFEKDGTVKYGAKNIATIGQKYLQNILFIAKLPSFSEVLVNTSLSGVVYLHNTQQDYELRKAAMSDYSYWRIWLSKLSFEPSLQNIEILPIDKVIKEGKLLGKYEEVIKTMQTYENDILADEKYSEVSQLLGDISANALISIILGENKYNPLDYGSSWGEIKEFYSNLRIANKVKEKTVSGFLLTKGKFGLYWNLEEIQLMLEASSLVLDNKTLGLKARLESILDSMDKSKNEYVSITEHLEDYWWMYTLLLSMIIVLFNILK